MNTLEITLVAIAAGALVYALWGIQTETLGDATGLILLGLKNNPKYIKIGAFTVLLAGALVYYNNFNK